MHRLFTNYLAMMTTVVLTRYNTVDIRYGLHVIVTVLKHTEHHA